jgi:hypothetical protein
MLPLTLEAMPCAVRLAPLCPGVASSSSARAATQDYARNNEADWRRYGFFNDFHYVRNLVEMNDDFELIVSATRQPCVPVWAVLCVRARSGCCALRVHERLPLCAPSQVLCWKTGQVSRVHNHGDSHCWLTVLAGEMREVQFAAAQPAQQRNAPQATAATHGAQLAPACGAPTGPRLAGQGAACALVEGRTTDLQVGWRWGPGEARGAGAAGGCAGAGCGWLCSGPAVGPPERVRAVGRARLPQRRVRRCTRVPASPHPPHGPAKSATLPSPPQVGDVGYVNDLLFLHSVGCVQPPRHSPPPADAMDCGAANGPGASCGSAPEAAAPIALMAASAEASEGGAQAGWALQGGVTLHLYAPPIRRVRVYEDGAVSERSPGFYSVGGVRV